MAFDIKVNQTKQIKGFNIILKLKLKLKLIKTNIKYFNQSTF